MRARRALPRADSGLAGYEAHASGYIYYYLDRSGSPERMLVKVDQVALEIHWAAPNLTKQRIVGLRDESLLPNRMFYHLDHLTVVQDEFGDVIRMGDGDEVRDVPHPAAPAADTIYQFRLADSLSLHLPGAAEPVRVYELEVRPRRFERPAFVGSIFVDRADAAIVRMAFTFTPSSYVDRRLDYIHVALDNGLWEGRYWLPHEQRVEIRRQVPQFEFPVGGVIRAVFRIGEYRFNPALPESFFRGRSITAAPPAQRAAFAFRDGLFDGLAEEGLAPAADLESLRRRAAELVGRGDLSGLPSLRVHVPAASSAVRYNRAEGFFLGSGLTYGAGATGLDLFGGYAFGARRPAASVTLRLQPGERTRLRAEARYNALGDLGVQPGAAGLLNTLAAASFGKDYVDPYFASGSNAGLEHDLAPTWRIDASLRLEKHRGADLVRVAAPLDESASFRPIRPVAEGTLTEARLALRHLGPAGSRRSWRGGLAVDAGTLAGASYGRALADLSLALHSADRDATVAFHAVAGAGVGDLPPQRVFLFGGRATLPGYAYRSFAGDRFALVGIEASYGVLRHWLRLRGLAALGWSDFATTGPPAGWDADTTAGARTSLGVGLGLIGDVLRLDLVRGLNDGGWRVIFSISPEFWDVL